STLVSDLYLPVGLTLSADEDFVAVAEFYGYRVTRYWLKGPKRGSWDRLIENLPGFPDGLASDGSGTIYISFAGLRSPILDQIHPYPWIKDQFAKLLLLLLSLGMQPAPGPGVVVAIDESGRVLRSFHDPEGQIVHMITAAEPHAGHLYLSSIGGDWIARCPIEDR
ncbi:MAG: SMP-30/gluconolactonase/LRE family protein, partial [Proteobacteria bacterium]|nr:SMP-30/gluconolactonase/LRE family protein [Pseudomonadota bacterium]